MKQYYRNLPHIQPVEAIFFVTARLHGSIPVHVLAQIREEMEQEQARAALSKQESKRVNQRKREFARFDTYLDAPQNGPYWLSEPAVAQVLVESFRFRDGKQYELIAFCVMSNHYHLVIDTRRLGDETRPLHKVVQSLHGHVAIESNRLLNRTGIFWHNEYYDHVIRDDAELRRITEYTLYNPVKAGLVDDWQAWPYCWVNETYW